MKTELVRPGVELLTFIEALVLTFIGFLFVILSQYTLMLVTVLPVSLVLAAIYLWEGFFRTPNTILVKDKGIELCFRTAKPKEIDWVDVLSLEIPATDPTTFVGEHLSVAKLHVKGEKRPFSIRIPPALAILEAKRESDWVSGVH